MTAARSPVDVAVGILIRPDGRLLLASRPEGKPYAGYWEFPGGKLEPGETVAHALKRELHEELGVDVGSVHPWVVRVFDYPHALVRLHFCRVFEWSGELHARERQRFGFFALDSLPAPLLPATVPVLRGLELPPVYGISAAGILGIDAFLRRLGDSLARGLRLVQLREPDLSSRGGRSALRSNARADALRRSAAAREQPSSASAVGGSRWSPSDIGMRWRPSASGRPNDGSGASVHDEKELARAGELGLDFAVLGPVQVTASHPGQSPLGWTEFERIAAGTSLPVYAIGGLDGEALPLAMACGAHGVALLSAAWRDGQCFELPDSVGGVSSASSAAPPGTT